MKNTKVKAVGTGRSTRFWAIISIATYISSMLFLREFEYAKALGYAVAMLTLLPFACFLWHFIKSVRGEDELEKQVQLEALAVAFPLSVLGIMKLSLLQMVAPLSLENWSYRHLLPFFFIVYFLGLAIARRRYGFNEKQPETD